MGDLGCGTGALLSTLAPHVARVIGVDASDEMLAAARARTAGLDNVELRRGTLEALPIDDATLDAATMMLVLHHLPSPALALAEAARVLKPGGRLLVVDMAPHEREEYRQQMGHVWLGFSARSRSPAGSQPAGFANIAVRVPAAGDRGEGPRRSSRPRATKGKCRSQKPEVRRVRTSQNTWTCPARTLDVERQGVFDVYRSDVQQHMRSIWPARQAGSRTRFVTWPWPSGAARRSVSPSRRCRA